VRKYDSTQHRRRAAESYGMKSTRLLAPRGRRHHVPWVVDRIISVFVRVWSAILAFIEHQPWLVSIALLAMLEFLPR
jgi:hypothetical protein